MCTIIMNGILNKLVVCIDSERVFSMKAAFNVLFVWMVFIDFHVSCRLKIQIYKCIYFMDSRPSTILVKFTTL